MLMVMTIDASHRALRFGVKTTPMHLAYDEILRVWEEAGPGHPAAPTRAVPESAAYGPPPPGPGGVRARLTETITILRRMWTEEVFDHDGPFPPLRGPRTGPGSVRPGGPPLLLGG